MSWPTWWSTSRMAFSIRGSAPGHSPGPWSRARRRLFKNRLTLFGALLLVAIGATAAVVPLVVPIDPYQQSLLDSLLPPGSPDHLLGTDHLGRDVLLRLIYGARVSLTVGFVAVAVYTSGRWMICLPSWD